MSEDVVMVDRNAPVINPFFIDVDANKEPFVPKPLDLIMMGERLRIRREEVNMTREDVAKIMCVRPKFIADVEIGQKGISVPNLYKLTQILNVSVEYIMSGKVDTRMDSEERKQINENIIRTLDRCNNEQMKAVAKIAYYFAEGIRKTPPKRRVLPLRNR